MVPLCCAGNTDRRVWRQQRTFWMWWQVSLSLRRRNNTCKARKHQENMADVESCRLFLGMAGIEDACEDMTGDVLKRHVEGQTVKNFPAHIVMEHVLQWWEGKVPRAMGNKNFLAVIWGGPRLHRGKEPTGAGLPSLSEDSLISSMAGEWLKGPCGPGKTHLKDRQESLTPHPNFILVSWRPWSSIWEYGWDSSKKTWSYISTKPEG